MLRLACFFPSQVFCTLEVAIGLDRYEILIALHQANQRTAPPPPSAPPAHPEPPAHPAPPADGIAPPPGAIETGAPAAKGKAKGVAPPPGAVYVSPYPHP